MRTSTFIKNFAMFAAMLSVFAFANCASRQTLAPQGHGGSVAPVVSVINVPIYMKTSVVENIVNEQLPNVLFNGPVTLGSLGNVNMTIRKHGRMSLRAQGDRFMWTAPVDIHIRAGSGVAQANVVARVTIRMTSRVTIGNNWRLNVATTVTDYEWNSEPVMRLGPLSIPVKSVADPMMPRLFGDIGKIVDGVVAGAFNIRSIVTPLWAKLQEPIEHEITPNLKVWLRLTPTDVFVSQPRASGGSVLASVGLHTNVEVFVNRPQARTASALPNFKAHTRTDTTSAIHANMNLTYQEATTLGQEILVGTTYRRGIRRVKFHDVEIKHGEHGRTDVTMDVTGSISGIMNASGIPVFNAGEQALYINDFNFNLVSKTAYHRAKNRMLSRFILSEAQRNTKISLKKTLQDAGESAQRSLNNHRLPLGFTLRTKIDNIEMRGIEVSQTGIAAALSITGEVRIDAGERERERSTR